MLGKVIGVAVGFALGYVLGNASLGLLLSAVGLFVGHMLIDRDSIPYPQTAMPPSREELLGRVAPLPRLAPPLPEISPQLRDLARALCPIFIEVARADGEVSQEEVRVVREFFSEKLGFAGDDLEAVRVALKDALKAPSGDLDVLVRDVRSQVKPADRLSTVNALYELALVDGELKRTESDAIKRVVNAFNLSEEQLREITATQLGSGSAHYALLGLNPQASDGEIKAAFRRLASEHHPDRFASEGPQRAEAAAEAFRKIKDAYEELKNLRGL